jgi:hypothetical protein
MDFALFQALIMARGVLKNIGQPPLCVFKQEDPPCGQWTDIGVAGVINE